MSSDIMPTAPAAPTTQPSVAICYPSGRVEKVGEPLRAAGVEVAVEPDTPGAYDVIFLDQPGSRLMQSLLEFTDTRDR
jgi:hypothetical protein